MMSKLFRALSYLVPMLALIVIVKGAYVRLSDAGLGCPDWPGCYGKLVVPATATAISADQLSRPLERGKAWREMIHRYLASSLGLLILLLTFTAWMERRPSRRTLIPSLLVPLVIFQGMLGMWTVTLLLKPLIVVGHLLGGIALLALAWWNLLDVRAAPRAKQPSVLNSFAIAALGVLLVQVFLGGWTSANYASLACTDFPRCHGEWWPTTNFREAFTLWRGLGINYEFGVLDTPARTAIHLAHRYWAIFTAVALIGLVICTLRTVDVHGRRIGWYILAALLLQLALGLTNVLHGLPLLVAVSHNGVAAILVASVVSLIRYTRPAKQ
jgi:heme a synthase